MTQRFSNAIVGSALFHGAVVALIFAVSYLAGLRTGKPLDVFELVAGEGDNYLATEAPALGTADGDATKVAEAPAPTMVMTTKAPAPTPAPKEVNLLRDVQKSAAKATAKLEKQAKAEELAAQKAAQAEALKQAKMTKEEFDKLNKGKTTPAPNQKTAASPKVDAKGIAGGVVGGSTANTKGGAGGTAMTAAARGVVEAYTSMLKQQLQKNLQDQSPPGLSDTLVATASMRMLPNGSLAGGTIVKSSGNKEFDKAVLDAIRLTNLPDRPSGFEAGTFTLDFKARDKGDL
jgi:TolA protein